MTQLFDLPTWSQLGSAAMTVLLCGLIGFEREYHDKAAGIRTNVLVGIGSWLFTMVSFYGYRALAGPNSGWDPSRIAAQVVSGIGFIGAGVIFVHRDNVRGLTTAAGIWVSAAIGMAAAANLFSLGILTAFLYFLVVLGVAPLAHRLTRRELHATIRLTYRNGKGSLRSSLLELEQEGFETQVVSSRNVESQSGADSGGMVAVEIRVQGKVTGDMVSSLARISGVKDAELLPEDEE
ncbi:MgtC/SapB family protein [Bifidobacterium sp.]|jgi:putative Mg2+ transporter-C (MgtC) family protein|uniref:MgtC/SapB family protein n=1 Tax=Bifidobacterium sp. TaxID=41200 RepID=UPI0025BFA2BE|nr:MgtC/SapB family protein [Bifidobacterium sp.]MCH4209574.1 MgtC/SapB family protein [Bifidobacterium sp.]MCI1225027.1 MgtC/SapB family protein [Bifidobacterium sp.]